MLINKVTDNYIKSIFLRNKYVSFVNFKNIKASILSDIRKDFGNRKILIKVFNKKKLLNFLINLGVNINFSSYVGLVTLVYSNKLFLFSKHKDKIKTKINKQLTFYRHRILDSKYEKCFLIYKNKKHLLKNFISILFNNIYYLLFVLNNIKMKKIEKKIEKITTTEKEKKIVKIVKMIKNLNSIEILDLSKELEKQFCINNVNFSINTNLKDNKEDNINNIKNNKSVVNINLIKIGSNRISIIRLIKEVTNLGLKESKEMTENLPKILLKNFDLEKANTVKSNFEKLGAVISFS